MQSIYRLTRTLLVLSALSVFASMAWGQTLVGPGTVIPDTSEISDQKAGSVLVYNFYSSSAVAPNLENTRINITNIHPTSSVAVHLFFIDGTTCSPADAFVCLTPNGTATFVTSDIDPGIRGYVIAVASDKASGCPIYFNYLVGDEYVKLASGHQANLGAEAISALFGGGVVGATLPGCSAASVTAVLVFDGAPNTDGYNKLPRTLVLDHFQSQADGNDTCVVLNRIGGPNPAGTGPFSDLTTSALPIGPLFAIVYDDAEQPFSVSFSASTCQLKLALSSLRTLGGGLNAVVPSGRSGWMSIRPMTTDLGLLGAVLNFNASAAQSVSAYNGGHNLHKVTLTTGPQYLIIPIFPPFC